MIFQGMITPPFGPKVRTDISPVRSRAKGPGTGGVVDLPISRGLKVRENYPGAIPPVICADLRPALRFLSPWNPARTC